MQMVYIYSLHSPTSIASDKILNFIQFYLFSLNKHTFKASSLIPTFFTQETINFSTNVATFVLSDLAISRFLFLFYFIYIIYFIENRICS